MPLQRTIGRGRPSPLNGKAFGRLGMNRYGLLIMFGLLGFGACSNRASVTVRNESSAEVQGVRVEGRCFAEEIGVLPSGASRTLRVRPCGESGIRARFTASGVAHETPELGYIEASDMYSVALVIGSDLQVRYSSH